MLLSKFFHRCEDRFNSSTNDHLTFALVPEAKSDGSNVIVAKCLDLLPNPFAALSFDDFSIQKCLENGVTYGALGITKDMRVGHESEFESLEKRFSEIESKMFVEPSK